jgi:pyruvate/2-oxoglutarate dehydrogenase complex dihydrolipoamide acyltransferase (E2) component
VENFDLEVGMVPSWRKIHTGKAPAGVMAGDELWARFYREVQHPEWPVREGDKVEPMGRIRKLTADHMVMSRRVSPHVNTVFDIDYTRVAQIRARIPNCSGATRAWLNRCSCRGARFDRTPLASVSNRVMYRSPSA